MATKKCPVCGVSVKAENLERHVRNQHPRDEVDLSEALTNEDRRAIREQKAAGRPVLTKGGLRIVLIAIVVVAALVAIAVLYPILFPGTLKTEFTLTSTDGPQVSMSSWRGTPVLVEFMDLDCPYCQQEAPVLVALYSNYSSRVKFVSISINFDPPDDTATRINQERSNPGSPYYGTVWPYCLDPGKYVQTNYGVSSTPTVFIVNKDGTVYHKYVGSLEAAAANLIAGLDAALGA